MKESGVSLIELLVVVSIVAIMIVALGFSYEGWMGNYRLESATKEFYFDLMDARSRAISHNRAHWALLQQQQYTIIEDTNSVLDPGPDPDVVGDGNLTGADALVLQKPYEYDYQLNGGGIAPQPPPQTITFDTRGLISWGPNQNELVFMFTNTRDPDFDCLVIEQSKMWMGEYNKTTDVCERR
jgi:prepilin-type N-terminal cleavage/methylation domain-containing protein